MLIVFPALNSGISRRYCRRLEVSELAKVQVRVAALGIFKRKLVYFQIGGCLSPVAGYNAPPR